MTITEQLSAAKRAVSIAEVELARVQAIIDADRARVFAKTMMGVIRAHHHPQSGTGGSSSYNIWIGNEAVSPIGQSVAALAANCLNETFDRIAYCLDNPDVGLSFATDGTPRLIPSDDSGIDHEALFKIGRTNRATD